MCVKLGFKLCREFLRKKSLCSVKVKHGSEVKINKTYF